MALNVISAPDLRYVFELCSRMPNMDQIQRQIIDAAGVDGDGGDAPFTFHFDTYSHNITLEWQSDGYWGASVITKKESN